MTQSPQPGEILSGESVKLLLDCLRGPHEWGYRCPVEGGFIADDRPYQAADVIQRQGEEIERLRGAIQFALDKLIELNPSNYDHENVCEANAASVEVMIHLAAELARARQGGPDHG